jgi:hypothetical protein
MGEKITGGYSITIESVVETDKNINYKCQRELRRLITYGAGVLLIRFVLSKLILKKKLLLDKKSHSSGFFLYKTV